MNDHLTSHRYHPDPAKPGDVDRILYDDCARCLEQADDPLKLDDHKLRRLWEQMVEVEHTNMMGGSYRNVVEATACRQLYRIALFVQRTQPHLDPWSWPIAVKESVRE